MQFWCLGENSWRKREKTFDIRGVVTSSSSRKMRLCAPFRRLAPFPSSRFTFSSSSRKRESRKSRSKSSPSSSFKDDDDADDDDSKVRCIALPDDSDDEKVDAFLSKTITDSEEEEDGPGTFALLTRMKKEDEWTRVHVQSTKALKRDILSATTMLKA